MSRPRTPTASHQVPRASLCQQLALACRVYRGSETPRLTQTQAAARVPVHTATWTGWENEEHFPDALVLMRLRTLGVDVPEDWIGVVRAGKRTKMKERHAIR